MLDQPTTRWRRHFLIIPLALTWLSAQVACAQEPAKEYAKEYVQAFKGSPESAKDFTLFGPDAKQCVKFEPDGLRITLPAGYPGDRLSTGVASQFAVQGDFEITVSYEILGEPAPVDAGTQTRFAIAVTLDKPNSRQDQAALNFRVVPSKGRQFFAWQSLKNEATGKPDAQMIGSPAKAKNGRLRLVRSGPELSYYSADGAGDEFVLLQKYAFGAENVRAVNLVAATGGPKAALDVRVTDLRVRAAGFPKPGPLPPAFVPAPPQKAYAEEYHLPLRERAESFPGIDVIRAGTEQTVQLEATGLHITLPAGWGGERPSSGLVTHFGVQGDFEATISFAILHEPKQEDAGTMGGTRIGLGAVKETLNSDATTISRTMSMKSGTIFYAWTSPFVNSRTGKNWALNQPLRTEAMTGRLRLVRSGADWYYAASEAVDGEFKYFARFLFGAEDVRQFRIIGMTGGENASLDVRVTDLRIRADAIPNMPDHPPRPVRAVEDPQQVGGKGWWAAGVLIGLAIVFLLALALGAWLYFRKRGFA